MKLRKVVSGILACAMILSSIPASANEAGGGKIGDEVQQGPHLSYIAPREGGVPLPARVSAGSEHYTEFVDRAADPANLVDAYEDGREKKIENLDGIWGFSGQVKSESTTDKFDVTGYNPMIIAFKLYFKQAPSNGNNGQVILSKGDDQYCISLIGNGLRFHAALNGGDWRNYSFSNCFTSANQWYDVAFVYDGKKGVRFYVNEQAANIAEIRSLSHFDDPFSIGTQISGGSGDRDLTSDCGYVADVKFYNGAAMEEEQKEAFEKEVDLAAWDSLDDKGVIPLYQLLETTLPTADFSLRPYRTVTEWSESQTDTAFTGSFQCGTGYTATTTLTVRDGETFRFTEEMKDVVENSMEDTVYYNQIPSEQLTGTADSEEKSSENGAAANAVDGNTSTIWHSNYNGINSPNLNSDPKVNNTYTITLEEASEIAKFDYLPRQGGGVNGIITNMDLYYSTTENEEDFVLIKDNIQWENNTNKKEFVFDEPIADVKRIRINVNAGANGYITAAEFYLYERGVIPAPDVTAEISEEGMKMTVQASYSASDIPCTHKAGSVSLGNIVDLEEGNERQLSPAVLMDDGTPLEAHKGFMAESIKYEYESANDEVATVSETGLVTAVGEGTTKITVTATIPGQDPVQIQVDVEVFAEGTMILHPEMQYKKPVAGKYPEIAEIWLNEETDDPYPSVITDVAEGEAHLEPVSGSPALDVVNKGGLIAFNGQYKSTGTTNQFNVTGTKPLVILFKLWVEKLPETGNEWAIVTKGNQFSFALKNASDTGNVPQLRLGMYSEKKQWPVAAYTIPNDWTGKWHDIVIVFDGKDTVNSMGFFVDGEFVPNNTQFVGTIGEADWLETSEIALRAFTICGKDGENQVFTKENGYLAGLKFFDVTEVAPELVEKINLTELGNENGAAIIKYMLDAKDRTAHITATPYKMQTTWSVTGENGVLDGKTPFTAANIRDKGYTATTVLTAYGDFVFDALEVTHIMDELRHIYVDPDIDPTLIEQSAKISDDHKTLTVTVSFLPRKMQVPSITYTSPIPGGTPRRQPISNDTDAHYTMSDSVWSVVDGDVVDEDDQFAEITETNKYQVQTVLTTKGDYLFDDSEAFIAEAKKNIETQRFGNVEASVDVAVAEDGSTMTITVTYSKPIYTVTFDLNGATAPASEAMQSVSNGNLPNKPETEPTRTGYEFVCWYETGDETQTAYDFTKPVTKSVSLTAKWAQYLNVTFDSGIEGSPTRTISVLEGQKITTKPDNPVNGEIEFLGWFIKIDDNAFEEWDFDNMLVTEEITLYAQWKDPNKTFTVTFMDGETVLETKTVTMGDKVSLPTEPTKTGYIFGGWFTDEDCTESFNKDGHIVSNMTLYAKWTPDIVEIRGITIDPQTFTLEIDGTKQLTVTTDPEDAKDAEVVWSSDDEMVAIVDENGLVTAKAAGTATIKAALKSNSEISAEASVSVTEKSTITEKNKYTVTFDSKGGSAVAAQTVEDGAFATQPANPTREGYTFAGWYTDEALSKAYDFKTEVRGNITLYAKWQTAAVEAQPLKKGEKIVSGDVEVQVLDANKRTVAISKGMTKNKKKVTIPGTITANGLKYTVIGVANKAFKGNKKITQITLPASVKSVGTQAFFGCKNLKKVILKGKTFKPGKNSFKNTSTKLKISAKKMTKKQRATLQKQIRNKGKNKKAKVTK